MLESLKLDAGRQDVFDRITRLVRNIFEVDVAAVSLIEDEMQHVRSVQGMAVPASIPLQFTFCRIPWREGGPVVIPDTCVHAELHDHPLVTADPFLRSYVGLPMRSSEGEAMGIICAIDSQPRTFTERELAILDDLGRLAASEFELLEWATRDTLTGTFTRRLFLKQAVQLCELTRLRALPMSMIVFDIDRFKSINDRFGHQAGDVVLAAIGSVCRANLRDHDLLGRLGGEEFGVALEGSAASALAVAERLRAAIAALPFTFAGETVPVTASFGVRELAHGPSAVPDAIARADAALYKAKAEGRNRVVQWSGYDS